MLKRYYSLNRWAREIDITQSSQTERDTMGYGKRGDRF